jgi:hypothetical protein
MYPQLAKMARDFLCCPLAGMGVERIFNFSREICSFRRGKLSPETIRALILLYFQMVADHRLNAARAQLDGVLDTGDWDEDDFLDAIAEITEEISAAESHTNELCQPQYISDEEELTAGTRTEWTRDLLRRARREHEKRRNMRRENELLAAAQSRQQTLGRPEQVRAQNEAIETELHHQRYVNRSLTNWEVPSDEENNQGHVDDEDVNDDSDSVNEDLFGQDLEDDDFIDVDDVVGTRAGPQTHPPTSSQLSAVPPSTPTLVAGVCNQNSRPAGSDIQVPATPPEVTVTLSKSRGRRPATNHNNNDNDTDMGGIDQMSLPAHPPGARPMLIPHANGTRRSASSSAQGSGAGRSASSSAHSKGTRHSASSSNLVPKATSKASKPAGIQKKTYSRQKAATGSSFSAPRNLIGDLHRSSQGFS